MAITDDRLSVKCQSTDKDEWKKAAEKEGRTLSNWVIWHLNRLAAEQLADSDSDKE